MSPTLKSTGGWSLWAKISGCSPWNRPMTFGSAKSEHPRLTNLKLFQKNSNTNLCDHNPPTSRTDWQTDRETTCDRKTALCTKVHHAVKTTSTGSSNYCYAQEMSLIRPVTKRRSERRNAAYSDILFTVIWWRRGSRLTEALRSCPRCSDTMHLGCYFTCAYFRYWRLCLTCITGWVKIITSSWSLWFGVDWI